MTSDPAGIETIFRDYEGDPSPERMERLIQACQGLVFHYAKLYGGGYCLEDLCQSGYEGLLKAVQNYEGSRGTKFTTYASHAIIGEIRHYVRKESRYYYPNYLEDYRTKLDRVVDRIVEEKEEPASIGELAEALNLKEESVLPLMSAGLVHLGHPEMAGIKAKELHSFTLPVEDKLLLSRLMHRLTGLQKDVIEMLFYKGMTQEEVARELKLTQKQVSRIKLKSLALMKGFTKE